MPNHVKPTTLKAIQGTARGDRETTRAVPELKGDLSLPNSFERLRDAQPEFAKCVLAAWNSKVAVYRQRGQSVIGCEDALLQYCMLEVAVTNSYMEKASGASRLISQWKMLAKEFYDTPASQHVRAEPKPANRFANNGQFSRGA